MGTQHAILSPSAAHRWLNCTAAPLYEATFPDETSEYAEEGTLAHRLCELKLLKMVGRITEAEYKKEATKCKKDKLWQNEMERTSDEYIDCIKTAAFEYDHEPYITAETRVDLSEYNLESFGTCDCVIIGGDTLTIVDYKHGKGVVVSADHNPQMMLYALGALSKYSISYSGCISQVRMIICQPRVDNISYFELSTDELIKWSATVAQKAQEALSGNGVFASGEWCKFCKAKAVCRTRAEKATAFEDFAECVPAEMIDSLPPDAQAAATPLTDAEVGDLLVRGAAIVDWYSDLKKYAEKKLIAGGEIPGWKLVEGRSTRHFNEATGNEMAEIVELVAKELNCDEDDLYYKVAYSLTWFETKLGKKRFKELLGKYVVKPRGKPTMVPITDAREPYHPDTAADDFSGVKEVREADKQTITAFESPLPKEPTTTNNQ